VRLHCEALVHSIATLVRALKDHDPDTSRHGVRAAYYALCLADELELPRPDRTALAIGAMLHDIGKLALPRTLLQKPAALTADEHDRVRSHPVVGDGVVRAFPWLGSIRPIVRNHHERWDGAGYPDGLAGENIPLLARVVAVADTFDAMTANRPYRAALPVRAALAQIAEGSGSQFDPDLAAAFRRRLQPARWKTPRR
jgi:putative nucleotidyltransferase with HDIG domain